MDHATLIGLFAGLALILSAGAPYVDLLYDLRNILFVAGGGLIATLVAHPMAWAARFPAVLMRALIMRPPFLAGLSARVVHLAEQARRSGILAVEEALHDDDDPFLTQGMRLAVDGTEPALIMDILETDLRCTEARHAGQADLVRSFGRGCLLFGGIGALMTVGLQGGTGLAGSALLHATTLPLLYGVLVFGLTEALARKLAVASGQEVLFKRMIIEGVMAIQAGDNPRLVEHKLSLFLEPRLRPGAEAGMSTRPPDLEPVDEDLVAAVRSIVRAEAPDEGATAPDGSRLFAFDDLSALTDQNVRHLLRHVDQKDLVAALKGATAPVRAKVLGNMSPRVRDFIVEEIGYLDLPAGEIAATQSRIAAQARTLAQQGTLELPQVDG